MGLRFNSAVLWAFQYLPDCTDVNKATGNTAKAKVCKAKDC